MATVKPYLLLALLGTLAACNSLKPVADETVVSDGKPTDAVNTTPALSNEGPRWKVGDRWEWSDGYALEVRAVVDGRTRFDRLDAPKQVQVREGLFPVETVSFDGRRVVVFRSEDPQTLLPFAVGKSTVFRREYLANGQLRVHNTSWMVEGQERIKVPAGEFDCWVLVRRTRSVNSDWVGFERWWYAPAVRHYVRLEYRYGEQPPGSRVLINYHLKT